jgi:hypothetical protein
MNARVGEEHKMARNELGTFVFFFGICSGEAGLCTLFSD